MASAERVYEILDIVDKQVLASPERWVRGEFEKEGQYCLVGAVCEVAGQRAYRLGDMGQGPIPNWIGLNAPGLNFALAELAITIDHLSLNRGVSTSSISAVESTIVGWQDKEDTTFEDIKRVLALTKERLWDGFQHRQGEEAELRGTAEDPERNFGHP